MKKIIIEDRVYVIHHKYDLYAACEDGYIIHIVRQIPFKGKKNNDGYLRFSLRKYGESKQKNKYSHVFVWETFNGMIPDGFQIDHIDDNKENNKLDNLQLITPSENCKKAVKNRKNFNNYQNIRSVKGTNNETNEVKYYFSIHSAGQHLEINSASVMRVCDGVTRSTQSKKDNHWYKFEYVEKNLPVNYIKSKNIRPRKKTDEEKRKTLHDWWNKEYKCPNCDIVIKNSSKYKHKKHCKM